MLGQPVPEDDAANESITLRADEQAIRLRADDEDDVPAVSEEITLREALLPRAPHPEPADTDSAEHED